MAKSEFTLRNYFKELKRSLILLVVFCIVGGAAGFYYGATRPTTYSSHAKISIYSPSLNNGAEFSPYTQLSDVLGSKKMLSEASEVSESEFSDYSVSETKRGIFTIDAAGDSAAKLKETVNYVVDNAADIIALAYGEVNDYSIAVLEQPSDVAESKPTTKSMIIPAVITAIAMIVLAAAIVFIKFDYKVGE